MAVSGFEFGESGVDPRPQTLTPKPQAERGQNVGLMGLLGKATFTPGGRLAGGRCPQPTGQPE